MEDGYLTNILIEKKKSLMFAATSFLRLIFVTVHLCLLYSGCGEMDANISYINTYNIL